MSIMGLAGSQLLRTVGNRVISSMPVNTFLSKKVSSDLIMSLVRTRDVDGVGACAVKFRRGGFSRTPCTETVSGRLKARRARLCMNTESTLRIVPSLPTVCSRPFTSSSRVPAILISELAGTRIAITLSNSKKSRLFTKCPQCGIASSL